MLYKPRLYAATSTMGNAIETADWIKKSGFNSIILVTANYHMPRSLMLFRHIMPEIRIIPHPVFPIQFEPRTLVGSSQNSLTHY